MDESRTVKELSRVVGIAIGRWLLSGLPLPDGDAHDGYSIEEVDMELSEQE